MSRKIFVKSIPRESAFNIHNWKSNSGKLLEKTKMGRCDTKLMALYSERVGGLANYISYNPWIDIKTGKIKIDSNGKDLMLQDQLEEKYNLPKNYLTNKVQRKNTSLKIDDLTYYQTKVWSFQDGTTVLDMDTMEGELGYYMCLASPYVANSEKEWREHKWPKALFYISFENESDTIKYQRNIIKVQAFAKLASDLMVPTIKRKFVSLLNLASTKSDLTNEQVDNLLFDYLEKSTLTNQGSNIAKFNALHGLLATPKTREEFEARYLLQQCLDTKVVFEKQNTYTWVRPSGNIVLGERLEDVLEFLQSPKKTKEVEELQEMIKQKL